MCLRWTSYCDQWSDTDVAATCAPQQTLSFMSGIIYESNDNAYTKEPWDLQDGCPPGVWEEADQKWLKLPGSSEQLFPVDLRNIYFQESQIVRTCWDT